MFDGFSRRLFWIYVAVVLVITIIGSIMILRSRRRNSGALLILWWLINIVLLFMIFLAVHINCCRRNYNSSAAGYQVLSVRENPFFVTLNVIFASLLVLSLSFVDRLDNVNRTALAAACLTILGGILIMQFILCNTIATVVTIAYILLWTGFIIYTILRPVPF